MKTRDEYQQQVFRNFFLPGFQQVVRELAQFELIRAVLGVINCPSRNFSELECKFSNVGVF